MDNRCVYILGHDDWPRTSAQAAGLMSSTSRLLSVTRNRTNCFFEINSSPRYVSTSRHEKCASGAWSRNSDYRVDRRPQYPRVYRTVRYGVDQARQAGLDKKSIPEFVCPGRISGYVHGGEFVPFLSGLATMQTPSSGTSRGLGSSLNEPDEDFRAALCAFHQIDHRSLARLLDLHNLLALFASAR